MIRCPTEMALVSADRIDWRAQEASHVRGEHRASAPRDEIALLEENRMQDLEAIERRRDRWMMAFRTRMVGAFIGFGG